MKIVPEVLWAEDKQQVYVTINVTDCVEYQSELKDNVFTFKATVENREYEVEMELKEEVKETVKKAEKGRNISFSMEKKKEGTWGRLMKTTEKPRWLKTDFSKFHDEESEEEFDFNNFANQMPLYDDDEEEVQTAAE